MKADVIRLAFQRLGMGVDGDTVTGQEATIAGAFLDAIFAEVQVMATFAWDLDTVPADCLIALANILAADLAPSYAVSPHYSRARSVAQLMSVLRPDDRTEDIDPDQYAEYY